MSHEWRSEPSAIFRSAESSSFLVSSNSRGRDFSIYGSIGSTALAFFIADEGESFERSPFRLAVTVFEMREERVSFVVSGHEGKPDFVGRARVDERPVKFGSSDDERHPLPFRFELRHRVFGGRGRFEPFAGIPRAGNHDVLAVRQGAEFLREGFVGLASHDDRFSAGELSEICQVFRQVPGKLSSDSDGAVRLRHGGDEHGFHVSFGYFPR